MSRRVLRAVVLGAVLALIVTTAASYVDRTKLQPRLDRYRAGADALADVHRGMVDEETGLRGFLATRETRFLDPYVAGTRELRDADVALASALGSTSELAARMIDLRVAQRAWLDEWAAPAANQATVFASPAELTTFLVRGKTLFDEYRRREDRLRVELATRLADTRRTQQLLIKMRYILEAVLFLAIALWSVRKARQLEIAIARPVGALLATMTRIREGDLSSRPAIEGPEELRQLAQGVSEMVSALESERAVSEARAAEVNEHTAQLHVILTLARDIAGSLSQRYVLDAVARSATTLSGFRRVRVWLADEGDGELTAAHDTDTGRGIPTIGEVVDTDVVARAARWGRTTTTEGERVDVASNQFAFPMIVGARVVGVVELLDTSPKLMSTETVEVLETMAVHAATAVEAARLHTRAQEQAEVDPLTRLFNRRRLEGDLVMECERAVRYNRPLAFVMLDADHFKTFNDTYGHQHGDEILQELGELLKGALRVSDTAYRYGGEEFCLMLRETNADGARELAERVRGQVEHRFTGRGISLTASFGVAVLPGDGRTPADLVAAADRALYDAKHAGRNCIATSPSAAVDAR